MIGPSQIIDKKFKGACIKIKRVFWKGKLHDITVEVDKSKGEYEVEIQRLEGPSRNLQQLFKIPNEVNQAIGHMDNNIETSLSQNNLILEQFKEISSDIDISNKNDFLTQIITNQLNSDEELQELKVFIKNNRQNQQSNRFRDSIEDHVQSRNTRYKKKLGIVLQTIYLFLVSKIERLEKESGVPKKSLYGYLKTLTDVKIIQSVKIASKFSKKGRRVLKYNLI